MSINESRRDRRREWESEEARKPLPVFGKCLQMCPQNEQQLRFIEKLVHPLESLPNSNWHGDSPTLVKQFSRSAAGYKCCKAEDLRPPYICRRTTNHLVQNILLPRIAANQVDDGLTTRVYDFIFDRLRSIRQDLSVQQVRDRIHLHVLEVCVKFHLLSAYTFLSSTSAVSFDGHINFQHLLECLKLALIIHQELKIHDECSQELISVYLLVNLGSDHAVTWALEHLSKHQLSQEPVSTAMHIARFYNERNFVGMFKRVKGLRLVPLLALFWKLPTIFADILAVMSTAYNSKALRFPLNKLSTLYLMEQRTAEETCRSHGISVENNEKIEFSKTSYRSQEKPTWNKFSIIEDKMARADWEEIFMFRNNSL